MFHVVFYHPEIPGNTGNALRMAAGAGCGLHLIRPLGFEVDDARLRRAGVDYSDRFALHVHDDLETAWTQLDRARVIAFTASADEIYTAVDYKPGDILLFGPESVGLPPEVLDSDLVTARARLPMVPGMRSLNLANSAAVAVYEAWRQHGFPGT